MKGLILDIIKNVEGELLNSIRYNEMVNNLKIAGAVVEEDKKSLNIYIKEDLIASYKIYNSSLNNIIIVDSML